MNFRNGQIIWLQTTPLSTGGTEKREKELWHPTVLFSCRPNTKYGENIFQSGGKAARDQAQGAVDMWWGPVSKRKLNLFCILHCAGTPRSRTTVLGQSQAREALSQDISPRSWGLLTSFVNICMQIFDHFVCWPFNGRKIRLFSAGGLERQHSAWRWSRSEGQHGKVSNDRQLIKRERQVSVCRGRQAAFSF